MAEIEKPDTPTNVVADFGQKGIKWADARKALEDVNNWVDDIPILEERFIGNTNDKIILEIIPPEGNVEGLIPSEDYRLQASILRENGDIEIIKTYDNPRQFGADGKNFFNDISSIDTPTNVVGKDSTGLDVKLSVSDDGYVQIWRATDDPNRLVISDFEKTGSGGRSGLGQQNYFSATPEYADEYSGGNRKLFQFETKIKPNEILNIDLPSLRNTHPELVSLFYDVEAPGGPIRLKGNIQSNIGKLKELGYKAVGTSATGNQRVGQVQFEIIPLIEDLDETYGIKSLDTPTNIVDDIPEGITDNWVDNLGKTTTSFIDNLPLETVVKNRVKKLVAKKSSQAATPGGFWDAVDAWELSVLGLMAAAVAFKEYDEIPSIITNKAVNMFNSMTSFYGIPPVSKIGYDLDYEYITKVLDTGEKYMPTDIIIKKVAKEAKKTYIPYGDFETKKENTDPQETKKIIKDVATSPASYYRPTSNREAIESMNNQQTTDTMEKTQKIQPGVQEEKMFKKAKPKKSSGGGSGARIL